MDGQAAAAAGWSARTRRSGGIGDPVQAYCDLLEVRWLLSEEAGRDVGDGAALDALANRSQPTDSAAMVVVAEEDPSAMRLPVPEDLDEYPPPEA